MHDHALPRAKIPLDAHHLAARGSGVGPVVGDRLHRAHLIWLGHSTGELGPHFISSLMGFTANTAAVPWAPKDAVMAHVNRTLENGPYLLGQTSPPPASW